MNNAEAEAVNLPTATVYAKWLFFLRLSFRCSSSLH